MVGNIFLGLWLLLMLAAMILPSLQRRRAARKEAQQNEN